MMDADTTSARIVVLDDDGDTVSALADILGKLGHRVTAFTDPLATLDHIASTDIDVVLTDLVMEGTSGLQVCERVLGTRPGIPVVVLTGQGSMEAAIAAIRVGAFDFLTKPVDVKMLALVVERALKHRHLAEEVRRLRRSVVAGDQPQSFVGKSGAMQRVFDLIARVAPSEASILIHGETGTGKEVTARAIHEMSTRQGGPFVAMNCAAIPPNLIESELFGHARGAFTDAKTQRTGLFVEATGGTLFIDEIGELPLEMQPKLLRALQERKVRAVGSNTELPFDARIVVATNRDLEREVEEKRFREDLYYRVNVVTLRLPPLRERGGDVLALASHFLALAAARHGNGRPSLTLSEPAAQLLLTYKWPGNVRELENCIERLVTLALSPVVVAEDLPEHIRNYRPDHFAVSLENATDIMPMDEVERVYVRRVLSLMGGNKTRTAELLGFDRRTLYRKVERWGFK